MLSAPHMLYLRQVDASASDMALGHTPRCAVCLRLLSSSCHDAHLLQAQMLAQMAQGGHLGPGGMMQHLPASAPLPGHYQQVGAIWLFSILLWWFISIVVCPVLGLLHHYCVTEGWMVEGMPCSGTGGICG